MFLSLLAIVFIALKLTNFIDWNWFWVLAPLAAVPLICFGAIILGLFIHKNK
jgi:hypothetical protein